MIVVRSFVLWGVALSCAAIALFAPVLHAQTPDGGPPTEPQNKQGGGQFQLGTNDGGFLGGKSNGEQFLGKLGRGLNFSGGWNLSAQDNQVAGSDSARQLFQFQNNNSFLNRGGIGPFRQSLNLGVNGKLFNTFNIDANLTNNRVNASLAQLLRLNYDSKKGTRVDLGDVAASLNGNELVPFSRNVQGIRYERDLGGGSKVATVASVTRAVTRRNTLLGQGTSGPYYLGGGQIVPGTERIYLNGSELSPGKDYRLDYPLGTLYFLEGRIVNRSDTVEYTYESLGYNTSPGVLTGTRIDLPAAKGQQFGITMLRQSPSGGGRGDGTVTEFFPVAADLNTRYTLSSPIKPGTPVQVRYLERVLVEGIALDFLVNRELNYIQLRRPLPPDTSVTGISSLRITYTPVLQLGISGGRDVMGLDTALPLGSNAQAKLQLAQSRDAARGTVGTGLQMQTTLQSPKSLVGQTWNVTTQLSDVGADFVGIDSTAGALQRNGRNLASRFNWARGDALSVSGNLGFADFPNLSFGSTSGAANTGPVSNTRSNDLGLNVSTKPRWKPWGGATTVTVGHQSRGQRTNPVAGAPASAGGPARNGYRSDTLAFNWTRTGLDLGLALDRTVSSGRSAFLAGYTGTVGTGFNGSSTGFLGGIRDGTSATSLTNTSTNNTRFNLNWTPSERVSVSGNAGLSRIVGSGTRSNATNMGLSAQVWVLPEKLSAQLSLENSGNGQSVSGFYSGGGFLGGGDSGGLAGSTGQQTRMQEMQFHYTPFRTLDVQFGRRSELSLIPNFDNTSSVYDTASVSYDPSELLNLTGTLTRQVGSQVGGQGEFDNLNYSLGATAGSPTGLTARLTFLRMNFGSTSFLGGGGGVGGIGGGGIGGGLGGGGSFLSQAGTNDIVSLRLDYPWKGVVPFVEFQGLNASDPAAKSSPTPPPVSGGSFRQATNYLRNEARLGVGWELNRLFGASLNVSFVRLVDQDDSRYSYSARTFQFDINARF